MCAELRPNVHHTDRISMTMRISSPFGAKSTADEVSEGIDLTGSARS
jgi:hypothetical protein